MPPTWLLLVLLVLNFVTWLAFGLDKLLSRRFGGRADRVAGQKGYRRVPEGWLLWMTFFGGWLGAWTAVSFFRHKTRKVSFRWRLLGVTVLSALWMVGLLVLVNRS